MDQSYSQIEVLSKIAFQPSKLIDLYQSISISDLLQLINHTQQNKDQLNNTIDALFLDPDIYKELLLRENSFLFVQTLLTHQNKKIRSLLSKCIENNDFEFGQLISKLVQEKSPLPNLILQVIF